MLASATVAGTWRRIVSVTALLACLLSASAPAFADAPIGSLVVKWRDEVPQGSAPAIDEVSKLAAAFGQPFSLVERTRDGAFRIELLTPLAHDQARAALNRARMLPTILYANLSLPAANPTVTAPEPPVRRLIVKYGDFASVLAAVRNESLSGAQLGRLSASAGQQVTHLRAMSGGAHVLRLSKPLPREQAQALAQTLAASDATIEWVEPDSIKQPTRVPNDPLFPQQWHYQTPAVEPAGVNLPPAWDRTIGSANIYVAVIDTGILPHPDLIGRYVGGYDLISDCAVANDNSAPCTFSPLPYDPSNPPQPSLNSRDPDPTDPGDWITAAENNPLPATNPPPPYYDWFVGCRIDDSSWHGTHVAGTIAAASDNAMGVAGVNWVSKVVPVRVIGKCGGYDSDIIDGIVWAVGGAVPGIPNNPNPARVINMSLGGGGACGAYQEAIDTALVAGAVIAVSAGNGNQDASNASPANCNGVITVAALARSGKRASYSNFGPLIEIAAPGGGATSSGDFVLSTLNDGATSPDDVGYDYVGYAGTSMAAPHVAGIASLMLSVNPDLTPAQVLSIIESTARPFAVFSRLACTTSGATSCGAGIIDAGAAVLASLPLQPTTTTLVSSVNPSSFGNAITLTATVTGTNPTGNVLFSDSVTGNLAGCLFPIPLTGSGNTKTAQCTTSALSVGTHDILADYEGDAVNLGSVSNTVSQSVADGGATSVNVALASAGAVAVASSTYSPLFPVSAIINGDRAGLNYGAGGVWKDGTVSSWPDWVEVDFSSTQTLDRVIVYSAQDNNGSPVDPSDTMTFTIRGDTSFDVQTWNGSAWITQASVTGNTLVKRTVSFAAVATSKIRVIINAAANGKYSFITEVEAWTPGTIPPPPPVLMLASSANPSRVGRTVVFSATLTGNSPTGTVAFTSNGSTIAGCGAVALNGPGNTRTAQCSTSFSKKGTYSIVAAYGGDGANPPMTSAPLAQIIKRL